MKKRKFNPVEKTVSGHLTPVCYGQVVSNSPALITAHVPVPMLLHPHLIGVYSCLLCGLQASIRAVSKADDGKDGKGLLGDKLMEDMQ